MFLNDPFEGLPAYKEAANINKKYMVESSLEFCAL